MPDSIIMEKVADFAADCFCAELVKTEDFQIFGALIAADMRRVAASAPRGWSVHERATRTVRRSPFRSCWLGGLQNRVIPPDFVSENVAGYAAFLER